MPPKQVLSYIVDPYWNNFWCLIIEHASFTEVIWINYKNEIDTKWQAGMVTYIKIILMFIYSDKGAKKELKKS